MARENDTASPASRPGVAARLVWFVALWLAGVASVGAVSLAIKWALK